MQTVFKNFGDSTHHSHCIVIDCAPHTQPNPFKSHAVNKLQLLCNFIKFDLGFNAFSFLFSQFVGNAPDSTCDDEDSDHDHASSDDDLFSTTSIGEH
mmetsp:Transcript_19240/g.27179  ORF Transcript_19240/g.27179 Transcript_19240/m.27179 type:complete len:97 (-) Transcript_19240:192-482(-)